MKRKGRTIRRESGRREGAPTEEGWGSETWIWVEEREGWKRGANREGVTRNFWNWSDGEWAGHSRGDESEGRRRMEGQREGETRVSGRQGEVGRDDRKRGKVVARTVEKSEGTEGGRAGKGEVCRQGGREGGREQGQRGREGESKGKEGGREQGQRGREGESKGKEGGRERARAKREGGRNGGREKGMQRIDTGRVQCRGS